MLFHGIFPYPSIPGTAYEVTLENRKVAITSIMEKIFLCLEFLNVETSVK